MYAEYIMLLEFDKNILITNRFLSFPSYLPVPKDASGIVFFATSRPLLLLLDNFAPNSSNKHCGSSCSKVQGCESESGNNENRSGFDWASESAAQIPVFFQSGCSVKTKLLFC